MRDNTSANHAWGSTLLSFAVRMSVNIGLWGSEGQGSRVRIAALAATAAFAIQLAALARLAEQTHVTPGRCVEAPIGESQGRGEGVGRAHLVLRLGDGSATLVAKPRLMSRRMTHHAKSSSHQ